MVITKSKDVMLFYQFRKNCKELYIDVCYPVCRRSGRICDEDECPIVKSVGFIDDFIDIVKRK